MPSEQELTLVMNEILESSHCSDYQGVVLACERYRLLGGSVDAYGPYLYPALAGLGEFQEALRASAECADDTITPVDQLKIMVLGSYPNERIEKLANAIIEEPMWFGWPAVVESLLIRAETLFQQGEKWLGWEDVKSAFEIASGQGMSGDLIADIIRVGKRMREDARGDATIDERRVYLPKLVGGPVGLTLKVSDSE